MSVSKYFDKAKELGIGFLACLLVLVILESLARIGFTVLQDLNENSGSKWYVQSAELGWEPRPGYSGSVYGVRREFDSEGFLSIDSAQITNRDKTKVLFLGDSNTFGVTVFAESAFSQQLEKLIPEVNAINLGVPGYTSFQGYQTLVSKGVKVNPDIVVISFNFNDRRYVLTEEDVDGGPNFRNAYKSESLVATIEQLRKSYLFRSIQLVFKKLGVVNEGLSIEPRSIDQLPARVGPEKYRENLEKMVELAKSRNAKVILLLLKDNPVQTYYLDRGIELMSKSRYTEAAASFKVTIATQPWFSSLSRIHLASIHGALGNDEERRNALTMVPTRSLHGGEPVYLDREYQAIMRDVARKHKVELIDAGQVLDEEPSDYTDFCHFNENAHLKVARLIRDRLSVVLSK